MADEKEISKSDAVKAYSDAKTKDEKAAIVEKYPILKEIFSSGNHS